MTCEHLPLHNGVSALTATCISGTTTTPPHTLKGNGGVAEPWISGGSMLKPHAIYGVHNTCRDYTTNGGMPTGAVPPAMQSVDQKHDMANSGDRPASMQTDIAAEVVTTSTTGSCTRRAPAANLAFSTCSCSSTRLAAGISTFALMEGSTG